MDPVRWGVLGTAMIALQRVIPAMQAGRAGRIEAIASRGLAKARAAAEALAIPKAYGTYEALLADPDIEAVYVPLPNHLHLEWSAKAMVAGKHVLCEKPIAMDAAEAAELIALRDATGRLIEEAFQVRNHPQWDRARELVRDGAIGDLRAVQMTYSYHLTDPANIRNKPETGGGALYDLGGYACTIARLVFDAEPLRALALVERDPEFGTDRLSSALLQFDRGHASFTVATQGALNQHALVLGSRGWIRADFPFAHATPTACRLYLGDETSIGGFHARMIDFDPVDQYALQGERFSRLVRGEAVAAWPLETALANMRVIDALYRSGESGAWQAV